MYFLIFPSIEQQSYCVKFSKSMCTEPCFSLPELLYFSGVAHYINVFVIVVEYKNHPLFQNCTVNVNQNCHKVYLGKVCF